MSNIKSIIAVSIFIFAIVSCQTDVKNTDSENSNNNGRNNSFTVDTTSTPVIKHYDTAQIKPIIKNDKPKRSAEIIDIKLLSDESFSKYYQVKIKNNSSKKIVAVKLYDTRFLIRDPYAEDRNEDVFGLKKFKISIPPHKSRTLKAYNFTASIEIESIIFADGTFEEYSN